MPSGFRPLATLCIILSTCTSLLTAAEIRDRAIISLTFDEASDAAAAVDSAKSGKLADAVALTGSPLRYPATFNAVGNQHSLSLDPAMQQQVVITHSEDNSRPDAVTISGMFACLHPLTDGSFHGLFAKRKPASGANGEITNYGINFQPSSDVFQIYVNDGSGYKLSHFSMKSVLGSRRRVHLTVSFDMGDAPGADADTDADDTRIRLYLNGTPVAPSKVTGGFMDGTAGWLQDVSLSKCVNDTPLTIGSSFPNGELTRLICDDIHIFAEAISDADAMALFAEVAGPAAAEITAEPTATDASAQSVPKLTRISPHAAAVGQTTQMIAFGADLTGAQLFVDTKGVKATPASEGNAKQARFDVVVDSSVAPGRYVARCVSGTGVSNPVVIAIDGLGSQPDSTFAESTPATTFPVAVSGVISGTEQKRLWFRAAAGQRITAEVEARRIGSRLDPVVEIRSQAGTPLAIQWQQPELQGDARTSLMIPTEGLYYAEVHDLQFAAPGGSPWRLFVGDLPPSSIAFPAMVSSGSTSIRALGTESVSEAVSVKSVDGQLIVESGKTLLPLPALRPESGTQISEPMEGTYPATPVDATFTTSPYPALLAHGRITAPKELDTLILTVTPKQSLHFSVAARATLSSTLRAHLSVLNGDAVLAQNDGESGAADPSLNVTVPDGVTQLKVQIRDLNGKGSPAAAYRLLVTRTDRQAFVLKTQDGALRLPLNGSVPLKLSVIRQSPSFRYTGPVRLSVRGVPNVVIVPDMIPASEQDQQILLMVTRSAEADPADAAAGQGLTIEARAEGADPVYTTSIQIDSPTLPEKSLTLPDDSLVTGPADAVPATILLDGIPPVLLRGVSATIPVRVIPLTEQIPAYVRFDLMTTEVARKEDPSKPDSPLKPMVSLTDFQFGPVGQAVFPLTLRVPVDVPSPIIDAVISAEFVPQPLAPASGSRSWTAPISLYVDDATTLTASAEPTKGAKNSSVNVTGTLNRHPSFSEPVSVVLDGLPQGFAAAPVSVAADQTTFSLAVMIPEAAVAGEVSNLTVRVQHPSGSTISQAVPVKIVVE
jgi:hypothetical protein